MASLAVEYRPKKFSDVVERSEDHTSELQSRFDLVCRLLLEKKKKKQKNKESEPMEDVFEPQ